MTTTSPGIQPLPPLLVSTWPLQVLRAEDIASQKLCVSALVSGAEDHWTRLQQSLESRLPALCGASGGGEQWGLLLSTKGIQVQLFYLRLPPGCQFKIAKVKRERDGLSTADKAGRACSGWRCYCRQVVVLRRLPAQPTARVTLPQSSLSPSSAEGRGSSHPPLSPGSSGISDPDANLLRSLSLRPNHSHASAASPGRESPKPAANTVRRLPFFVRQLKGPSHQRAMQG